MSDLLIIWLNHLQKWVIRLKICIFCTFFPFLCLRANPSHQSLLIHSFFKRLERFTSIALYKQATESDSLRSLMTKEQPWAIRSGRSWQKSDWSNLLCFMGVLLLCSFAHKKWANHSKNWWANSQPWWKGNIKAWNIKKLKVPNHSTLLCRATWFCIAFFYH